MKSSLIAAAAALALAGPAFADQCAWLDKAQTAELQKLIDAKFNGARGFIAYCESCGDKLAKGIEFKPGVSVAIKKEDEENSSFSYDGETLDAAYIWLPAETGEPPFKGAFSLAKLVGCPHDTPDKVDIDTSGKVTPSK